MGRFLTRDTWDGDANSPISFNRWNYVEGNPVNLTDPSGQNPCKNLPEPEKDLCELEIKPPKTSNYNPTSAPINISWYSNGIGRWINQNGAPIIDKKGNKVSNTDTLLVQAAQFSIRGLEWYCGKRDENGDCIEMHNQNYCGEVILSALMDKAFRDKFGIKTTTTDMIIAIFRAKYELSNSQATDFNQLSGYLNDTGLWSSRVDNISSRFSDSYSLLGSLVQIIRSPNQNQIIHLIGVGSRSGVVGKGTTSHWVLITGISREWDNDPLSPWNWIRIFNPFNNRTEYYWWEDYYKNWKNVIHDRMIVASPKFK